MRGSMYEGSTGSGLWMSELKERLCCLASYASLGGIDIQLSMDRLTYSLQRVAFGFCCIEGPLVSNCLFFLQRSVFMVRIW